MFKLREATKHVFRDRAILETLYCTGIRVSELTSIEIADVDFNELSILVNGKGTAQRYVFFTPECKEILLRHLEERKAQKKESVYLFTSTSRNNITRQGVWKILKHYAKKTGLKKICNPHIFRSTFACVLAERGFTDEEIMELLGHEDPATIDHYKKLTEQARKAIYDRCR